VIQYANADTQTHRVTLCASDYQAIAAAAFLDKDGNPFQMTEDIPDSGFYQLTVPDPDYVFDGTERVVVTNIAGQEAERTVALVFHDEPVAPVFNAVELDIAADPPVIYANITNPNPNFSIQWVRVFHSELDDGVLEMRPPVNAYEDPDGWFAALPQGWEFTNLKVVAFVRPGIWSEIQLSDQFVTDEAVRHGTVTMLAGAWFVIPFKVTSAFLDFDVDVSEATGSRTTYEATSAPHAPASQPWDVTHFLDANHAKKWLLHFNQPHVKTTVAFENIDPDLISNELNVASNVQPAGDYAYEKGDVFVLQSDEGYLVKLRIADTYNGTGGNTIGARKLTIEYVVYNP
jgi:hypothetical protein